MGSFEKKEIRNLEGGPCDHPQPNLVKVYDSYNRHRFEN